MLDPLPVPAYIWDIETESFLACNSMFLDLLGYSEEEVQALNWRKLVVAEEIGIAERAIEKGPAMGAVSWNWYTKDSRVVSVTLASRRTHFVDERLGIRDVYIALVIGRDDVHTTPANAAF